MNRLLERLQAAAMRLVDASHRYAFLLVAGVLLLTGGLGWVAGTRLGIDTDLNKLIATDVSWRQEEIRFDTAFPQLTELLAVVVDGTTPEAADAAAAALAARMAARPDLFQSVRRPDADPFFRRNGLLFLPLPELEALTAQLIEAQPFLGALVADPSLRGLFATLNLFLEGVTRGEAPFSRLEKPLAAIAGVVEGQQTGRPAPLSWEALMTGRTPRPQELRRFILSQPLREHGQLASADRAMAMVRGAARELGLVPERGVTVRLTGGPAVESEELRTLEDGMGLSMLVSTVLVAALLLAALRTLRLILPVLVTLVVGLVWTAGFAALALGRLNPISVAFAVMFVGLAVDFGIQFTIRYREERFRRGAFAPALTAAGAGVSGALVLAALTIAAGFYSFLPTAYVGVSELGLIAGTGMLIAVFLTLTLLPALLTLARPGGEAESVGYVWAGPADRFLARHCRGVLVGAVLLAGAGMACIPVLRFDANPMHLRDPGTESIATALDLQGDPDTTPFSASALLPSLDAAAALAERLEKLPEVHQAITARSFIPERQDEKLALVADARLLLEPTLTPGPAPAAATPAQLRAVLAETVARLERQDAATARRLAAALGWVLKQDDSVLSRLEGVLLDGLPAHLESLRLALEAAPVTLDSLGPTLRREWLTPDGQARLLIQPKGDAGDDRVLARFVDIVSSVVPMATGAAVTLRASADTIIGAFLQAGLISLVAISLVLWLVLRCWRDVGLTLAPLILAALLTLLTSVLVGPVLNFANVIALPLLLGIGVAFNIYFVINHRQGVTQPLQSPTTRAVVFSALTTAVAFGSLVLADHPGTASMGLLLSLSLGYNLLAVLVVEPALLAAFGSVPPDRHAAGGRETLSCGLTASEKPAL